jgi:hypothetical protein
LGTLGLGRVRFRFSLRVSVGRLSCLEHPQAKVHAKNLTQYKAFKKIAS